MSSVRHSLRTAQPVNGWRTIKVSPAQVILVCCFAAIEWFGWFAPVRAAGEVLLIPLVSQAMALIRQIQEPLYVLTTRGVRLDEYQALQRRYAEVLVRVSVLETVEAENRLLRQALDAQLPDQQQLHRVLVAPVLTADGTYVAVGNQDGVQKGALVLAQGVLVGFVEHQTAHQSRVLPVQQRPADEPILVKTERGASGLVNGVGKQIVLREVARDSELVKGDRVLTAGQEGIQAGLVLGTIRSIENRPSAPTLSAVVDQPTSLYEVALVEIW